MVVQKKTNILLARNATKIAYKLDSLKSAFFL